jgi:hypothetical protein
LRGLSKLSWIVVQMNTDGKARKRAQFVCAVPAKAI